MSALTVDATVWIAAQDPGDVFCRSSRGFLSKAAMRGTAIYVPAHARVEVTCALARKLGNAEAGQRLTEQVLATTSAQEIKMDDAMLASALAIGTKALLRGTDALYAATAHLTASTLVSWDNDHVQCAGGITPADWMAANP